MKPTPTLLCIPDISGFTRFMHDVDIEVSSQVIPSLLNKIIYSNTLQLKVSEIEGDAVLFYRTGELPNFLDLVQQCKNFYTEFYTQMEVLLDKFRKKHSQIDFPEILGLKIILHYGPEIGMVQIGNRIKLMGEDVITAHRLLKNDIPINEYLLVSEQLLAQYDTEKINGNFDWASVKKGVLKEADLGNLPYRYLDLKPLKKQES